MACGEEPVVGPALLEGIPAGEGYDGRRRSHGLRPPVQTPHHGECNEYHGCRDYGMCEPHEPHQGVGRGRDDESRGHEALDVAVVGDESVDELADGIGEEECRADDSQLRCVQGPAVENGFLHDVETGAADVVEAVSERCGDECLQAQAAVVLVARCFVLLPGRSRRADAVEFRNTAHGVSRAVRASGGRRSAVRGGRSGSWWRPYRPVSRTPRPGRPLPRHRRKARRSGRATGSSPTVSSRRR